MGSGGGGGVSRGRGGARCTALAAQRGAPRVSRARARAARRGYRDPERRSRRTWIVVIDLRPLRCCTRMWILEEPLRPPAAKGSSAPAVCGESGRVVRRSESPHQKSGRRRRKWDGPVPAPPRPMSMSAPPLIPGRRKGEVGGEEGGLYRGAFGQPEALRSSEI